MKKAILTLLTWYQGAGNLWYPLVLVPPQCKFYPTCSEYAVQVIQHKGIFKGGVQALVRICRCHPLSRGGIDLVS